MYQTLNVYQLVKPVTLDSRKVTGYIITCNDDYSMVSRKGSAFSDFAEMCAVHNDDLIDIPLLVFSQREELVNLLTIIDSDALSAGFPVNERSYSRAYIISETVSCVFRRCSHDDKGKESTPERFFINMGTKGNNPSQAALILTLKTLKSKIDDIRTFVSDRRHELFNLSVSKLESAVLNFIDCAIKGTSLTIDMYYYIDLLFFTTDSSDWHVFNRYYSEPRRYSITWWVILPLLCLSIIFFLLFMRRRS